MKYLLGISILLSVILGGCVSGDAPLLSTPLPNGYTFESNGGGFGYIRSSSGRLSSYFGIVEDGTERWCNEFGWDGAIVVCAMEVYPKGNDKPAAFGYFIFNTATSANWFASNEVQALEVLQSVSVSSLPKLSTYHWFVTKRRS